MLNPSLNREVLLATLRAVSSTLHKIGKANSAESWLQEHDLELHMMDDEEAERALRAYCNWLARHQHPDFEPAIVAAARATAGVDYMRAKAGIWEDDGKILRLIEASRPSRDLQTFRQMFAATKGFAQQSMEIRQRVVCARNSHDRRWTDSCWTGFADSLVQIMGGPRALLPWDLPAEPTGPAYLFRGMGETFLYTVWPFETVYMGPPSNMRALSQSRVDNRSGYFDPQATLHIVARDLTWALTASFDDLGTSSIYRSQEAEAVALLKIDPRDFEIAPRSRSVRITARS